MVTVYSKRNCVQCNATIKYLEDNNINFKVLKVDADEQAATVAKGFGYLQAPVVVLDFKDYEKVGEPHFSGFRPDLLELLK